MRGWSAVAVVCLVGCARVSAGPIDPFELGYHTTAEATHVDIRVQGTRLRFTTFEDRTGRCKQWVASRPCWQKEDLQVREAALSQAEITDLQGMLRQHRFFDWPAKLGDVSARRAYARRLFGRL